MLFRSRVCGDIGSDYRIQHGLPDLFAELCNRTGVSSGPIQYYLYHERDGLRIRRLHVVGGAHGGGILLHRIDRGLRGINRVFGENLSLSNYAGGHVNAIAPHPIPKQRACSAFPRSSNFAGRHGLGHGVLCDVFISLGALAFLLGLTGLDFITALSGAATAIGNIGPGLGPEIGPTGNFENLNSTAKGLLIFGMILGRLELMAVFVLFTRRFCQAA